MTKLWARALGGERVAGRERLRCSALNTSMIWLRAPPATPISLRTLALALTLILTLAPAVAFPQVIFRDVGLYNKMLVEQMHIKVRTTIPPPSTPRHPAPIPPPHTLSLPTCGKKCTSRCETVSSEAFVRLSLPKSSARLPSHQIQPSPASPLPKLAHPPPGARGPRLVPACRAAPHASSP